MPLWIRSITIGMTKVVGTGWVRWAWARTVGSPPFGLPLKRVIGEETGKGACSGSLIWALPKPLPTIAPGQSLRAVFVVVAIRRPTEQVGRPVVTTEPWRSNSIEIVSSLGGRPPETVEIRPPPRRTIGALRSWGRTCG